MNFRNLLLCCISLGDFLTEGNCFLTDFICETCIKYLQNYSPVTMRRNVPTLRSTWDTVLTRCSRDFELYLCFRTAVNITLGISKKLQKFLTPKLYLHSCPTLNCNLFSLTIVIHTSITIKWICRECLVEFKQGSIIINWPYLIVTKHVSFERKEVLKSF